MEIFTYVIDGQLSHMDSMGNKEALSRGAVQYLSAGTGITHSVSCVDKCEEQVGTLWDVRSILGMVPAQPFCLALPQSLLAARSCSPALAVCYV